MENLKSKSTLQFDKKVTIPNESFDPKMVEESFPEFMEYEEYHLKKSKVTLFELKDEIKSEISMIIPF